MTTRGWKWDVDIYDRPGWHAYTYTYPHWGGILRRDDCEIIVRFESADENAINDDFYIEHYRAVFLSSRDDGLTWREVEPQWTYNIPVTLSEGTLVEIVEDRRMHTGEEQRKRLEDLGISEVWRDDCLLAWDLWPAHMTEELKSQGYIVWDRQGDGTFVWLPEGVVATHKVSTLVGRTSSDGGATWQDQTTISMDDFVHFSTGFPYAIALPDDTILSPFYGVHKRAGSGSFSMLASEVYVLRSTDKGRSYDVVKVGGPIDDVTLTEADLVYHPSGRIVALIRGTEIHCSVSDDGGKTWSTPRPIGLAGRYPLHGICLTSGNILCVYAHRSYPAGIRATLSYDVGESWDVEHEKVLRDDIPPNLYIGTPASVQLDDGTIFTYYNIVKGKEITPERLHCYIAGSRYTEDYVRPLG